jgi:hypothetical protein
MAITYLGTKRLQGTKVDRVSDSLGSSGDGTNSGITLIQPVTGGTDLTSSSQSWTQDGTEIVKTNDTITATNAGDDGGSGSTGSDRVYTTLPSTLSNTQHTTDFDFKITANAPSGDPDIVPIMYTAGTTVFGGGSQDGYGIDVYSDSGSGNNYNMRLIARDGTDNDYSSTITLTPTTQYYCRLVRNSATLGTLNVYTDSTRTTHASGSPKTLTIASGSDRGKDCTHLQSSTWSQSAHTSYKVENVKLYNDKVVGDVKLGSGCYDFDQSASGKVEVGSASDWQFLHNTGAKWTIATWFKRPTAFNGSSISGDITWLCETTDGNDSGISIKYDNRQTPNHQFQCEIINESNGAVAVLQINEFYPDDDNWHHLAVTFDQTIANTNLIAYLDGVQKGTANKSATPSDVDSGDTLRIGGGVDSHARFGNWTLDDFGIYSRALTATEIQKLAYNNDSWSANDSTNISVSGTELSWNAKRDSSNDACVYDLTSTSANWVLRFKLKVTEVNSTTQAGNGFYVGLSDKDQTAGQSTSQDFIGVSIYNDNQDTFRTIDADGSALPRIYQGDTSRNTTYNTNSVWYYEIVKNGSSYTVNAFSNSDYSTGGEGSITGSSSASGLRYLKVTNDMENISTSTNPFKGTISEIKFYDNQTSATTITKDFTSGMNGNAQSVSTISNKAGLKAHYSMDAISGATSGIAPDDGGNANSYSNVSVDTTNKKAGTGSYDFADGGVVGNSNQSYGISGTASWTISCWIRPHAVGGNEALFRKQHADGNSDFEFAVNSSNIFCWIEGNSTNMVSSPANNTWYHLVVRRVSGDKDYFYVNGSEVSSTSTQNSIDDNSGFRWYLGRRKESGNETFNGNMDEWGIWNRALTTSEITALYNSGDGAKIDSIDTTDLVIYWNFEQVPLAQQALPKCSNDASATSELDGVNAEVNTIFEQTDDTPDYYWKQSDGTWALSGIPTARAWWDMSASDTTVSNVTDKTGNGFSLKQATSSKQPSIVTSAQNGLNALSFTKDDDFMLTENNFRGELQQTIFCVFKVTKETANGWQYYLWDGAAAFNAVSQYGDNWRISADGNVDSSETSWDRWLVFTAQFNGSSSFIRDNGTQTAINSTSESEHVNNGFTLNGYSGRSGSDAGRYGGNVDWGECIVYNRLLDSSEINRVEKYLKDKWGTP